MAHKNLFFLKNIKFKYLDSHLFNISENNFLFFKKNKKSNYSNTNNIIIKKINFNKNCINVIYF